MAIQNLFVPRARLANFGVQLQIEDLNNVPPLNGLFYAKWRLQDHSGTSNRVPVANREVRWAHKIRRDVEIPVGKEGVLTPCELKISIKQEMYPHVNTKIGTLSINLSEYARLSGSSRRYFLQECKLNCTLKLTINVVHESGPEMFDVPPLDRSMVLTDLNDMLANESQNPIRRGGNGGGGRDTSSMGNSTTSRQPSAAVRSNHYNRNSRGVSASSAHSSATTSDNTSLSRALLPIDNTSIRDLAPSHHSSKKNQQIVDDVFFNPTPELPS